MERSLIHLNQCRFYVISVYDNPTNGHQYLGIDTEEDLVPMCIKGTTCTFTKWCPMDEEFHKFHQILLSNDYHWDPSANIFNVSVMGEGR